MRSYGSRVGWEGQILGQFSEVGGKGAEVQKFGADLEIYVTFMD